MENEIKISQIITKENLLAHWQGHRRLTRKVIMAFDDDKLFNYSIGGMRPFSEMAIELITIAAPGVIGMATGNWKEMKDLDPAYETPKSQEEILQLWDKTTNIIDQYWPKISSDRFRKKKQLLVNIKVKYGHIFSISSIMKSTIGHKGMCILGLWVLNLLISGKDKCIVQ